jgi:peptide deformylase
MKLPIYVYGEPVLREVAADIKPDYPELKQLIADMYETLENAEGVGLAAPQIGLPIRLVVIDLRDLADEYPEYKDFLKTYINARIEETSDETCSIDEGCLSIPGIHEKVTRPKKVRVKYLDENFEEHDEWADGFLARVMQHEFAHLEGKVFTDIISPLRRQMIARKLKAIAHGSFRCPYKTKFNRHLK